MTVGGGCILRGGRGGTKRAGTGTKEKESDQAYQMRKGWRVLTTESLGKENGGRSGEEGTAGKKSVRWNAREELRERSTQ